MSLTNYVASKNRVYVRRFDHEEALARYSAGESVPELARAYDVSNQAIRRVVVPGEKERDLNHSRRWRAGTCEVCGGPAVRLVAGKKAHNHDGRILCHRCRSEERRERLLFDDLGVLIAVRCSTLDCANGERWQPPSHFPRGRRFREVREGGIHGQCRSCGTRARKKHRDSRRVPCDLCGSLCLHPNDKGGARARRDRNLCVDCYRATEFGRTDSASRAREPEAVEAARETGR